MNRMAGELKGTCCIFCLTHRDVRDEVLEHGKCALAGTGRGWKLQDQYMVLLAWSVCPYHPTLPQS